MECQSFPWSLIFRSLHSETGLLPSSSYSNNSGLWKLEPLSSVKKALWYLVPMWFSFSNSTEKFEPFTTDMLPIFLWDSLDHLPCSGSSVTFAGSCQISRVEAGWVARGCLVLYVIYAFTDVQQIYMSSSRPLCTRWACTEISDHPTYSPGGDAKIICILFKIVFFIS